MLPELDHALIDRWVVLRNSRLPDRARGKIRYELDVTDTSATIVECRPPWRPELGSDWSRLPIARLRYNKARQEWSLHWRDRNLSFHVYDRLEPKPHVQGLLAEVDRDPTHIFWG